MYCLNPIFHGDILRSHQATPHKNQLYHMNIPIWRFPEMGVPLDYLLYHMNILIYSHVFAGYHMTIPIYSHEYSHKILIINNPSVYHVYNVGPPK